MKHLIYIALVFVLISCKEQLPPQDYEGQPVFYAEGSLENQAFSWLAGKEGLFMFTEFATMEDGVPVYSGYLASEACEDNCKPQLRFLFYGHEPHQEEPSESVLFEGQKAFAQPELLDVYEVNLQPETWISSPGTRVTHQWRFGDSETASSDADLIHHFPKNERGYTVCLESTNTQNQLKSSICKELLWDDPCQTGFEVKNYAGYYTVEVLNPNPSTQYEWAFASGRFANGSFIECEYGESSIEKICLTTNTIDGCFSTSCANVVLDSSRARIATNFDYSFVETQIPGKDFILPTRVEIEYTDAGGTVYRSSGALQPSVAQFEIVSAEDFEDNAASQNTKKLELIFSCDLFNGDTKLEMRDFHAVIAVATNQAP